VGSEHQEVLEGDAPTKESVVLPLNYTGSHSGSMSHAGEGFKPTSDHDHFSIGVDVGFNADFRPSPANSDLLDEILHSHMPGLAGPTLDHEHSNRLGDIYPLLDPTTGFLCISPSRRVHYSPMLATLSTTTSQTDTNNLSAVQQAWPRRKAVSVRRIVHTLWQAASDHDCRNLFSSSYQQQQTVPISAIEPLLKTSRWNMDVSCRDRLVGDCDQMLHNAEQPDVSAPMNTRHTMGEVGSDRLFSEALIPPIPSHEVLDMSIDNFFRRTHPVIPFIHAATFDATLTPSPFLLTVCLIGLDHEYCPNAKALVCFYLSKLIRYCRHDLTYNALGKTGVQQLLTSLATATLVLYLGLSYDSMLDEHEAHMLLIQVAFIADRHGLFEAKEPSGIDSDAPDHAVSTEVRWAAWARGESTKRFILSLISIDSTYTHMLDLAANIGLERVLVVLPVEPDLFAASSASEFEHRRRLGMSVSTARVDLIGPCSSYLESLDGSNIISILHLLALQEAAFRHSVLPVQHTSLVENAFVPARVLAIVPKFKHLAGSLSSISTQYVRAFEIQPDAALLWNHSCLALCVELSIVHVACGKDGMEAAQVALAELSSWVRTPSARRSILHAAQIFYILSRHRVADNKLLLIESRCSDAALVFAVYAHLCRRYSEVSLTDHSLELLQDIDWGAVRSEGLDFHSSSRLPELHSPSVDAIFDLDARSFILHGGQISFGGSRPDFPQNSARRIMLDFASLLEEIAIPHESEHLMLLRTVAESFVIRE
jgi:hypothetical protein